MSFQSPQQSQSAEQMRFNSAQAQTLANITLPEIQETLSGLIGGVQSAQGGGGIPANVQAQYAPIIEQTNKDYAMAGQGQSAYIQQVARQSGNIYNQNAVSDSLLQAGQSLERSRRQSQQNIAYSEAAAGLQEYNTLLDLMGGASSEALSLGGGWSGQSNTAIGLLPNTSQGQSIAGGAISGAGLGTSISPGWGTLIGAVVGAGYGALSYGN